MDGNKNFRKDPGPLFGDPYTPAEDAIPSSWGGPFSDWGEHGNGYVSEPGEREKDKGVSRKNRSKEFTEQELMFFLKIWDANCCISGKIITVKRKEPL